MALYHLYLFIFATIAIITQHKVACTETESEYGFAVDLGNEWIKVCVVSPTASSIGSFVDVAINEQSNRKTPSMIGFDADEERVIGEDAQSLFYKNPVRVYSHIPQLARSVYNSSVLDKWKRNLNGLIDDKAVSFVEGTGVVFSRSSLLSLPSSALLAMLYANSVRLARQHLLSSSSISSPIKSAVLLSPPYYSDDERNLQAQIAAVAGIDVVAVIDDTTAVAIDYGVRNVNTPSASKHIVIWSGGASSVNAVLYKLSHDAAANELTVTQLAVASNTLVGGFSFDLRVQSHLVNTFDSQFKTTSTVALNKRAASKLLREARDAKEQLTVSPFIQIELQELHDGRDFKFTLTKETLDTLIQDLIPSTIEPLTQVLKAAADANIKVDCVELYGGALRVRSVIAAAETATGLEIGRHIDGEEAAVLGAAHYLASVKGKAVTKIKIESSSVSRFGSDSSPSSSPSSLSSSALSSLSSVLSSLDAASAARAAASTARSDLESQLFQARELVEKAENAFKSSSKSKSKTSKPAPAQESIDKLEALKSVISSSSSFLDDISRSTTASEISSVLSSLSSASSALSSSPELMADAATARAASDRASEPTKARRPSSERKQAKARADRAKAKAQPQPKKPAEPKKTTPAPTNSKKKQAPKADL